MAFRAALLQTIGTTLGLPGSFLLAGCFASAQPIDDRAQEQTSQVLADVRSAVIWTRCPDPARPLGLDCGLLSEGLRSDEFLQKFEARYCLDTDAEACQARHERYYAERLRSRYFAADTAAVERQCDLYPGSCDDPVGYEKKLLRSHNDRIHDRAATAAIRIEHERVEAQRQRAAYNAKLAGDILATVGFLTHQGPRCIARGVGSGSTQLITCNR